MHIILLLILFILSISIVGFSLYTGISPMPSSRAAQKAFLKVLPQNAVHIYELGSGWGGVAFAMARACPKATIHAFELSWVPWLISICIRAIYQYKNVKIYRRNFFCFSLSKADVVVCYLYPGAMCKLRSVFEKELRSKTQVLSNSFAIHGWKPHAVIPVNDIWHSKIYAYIVN